MKLRMKLRWHWYVFWDRLWRVRVHVVRVWCWFFGHKKVCSSGYDQHPDYCGRCFVDWPQDKTTLPKHLNHAYCWTVEREWRWFDWLDELLQSNHWTFHHLPSWWEY